MALKDEVISIRFTKEQTNLLNKIAKENEIPVSKVVEKATIDYIEVLSKCFKRQDLIIQKDEIRELYSRFSKDELDSWIEKKYFKTTSCMQLFAPLMNFDEITKIWLRWFKLNNHYLYHEDKDEWRQWVCDSSMGYNWTYVNGKIYQKMFKDIGCEVKDFDNNDDGFKFKVKIRT